MKQSKKSPVGRRGFLKGAAAGPRPGTSPAGQQDRMPAYSAKVLPDAELADVYAYIKTLPESPAAKDIPLLNQLQNQK